MSLYCGNWSFFIQLFSVYGPAAATVKSGQQQEIQLKENIQMGSLAYTLPQFSENKSVLFRSEANLANGAL